VIALSENAKFRYDRSAGQALHGASASPTTAGPATASDDNGHAAEAESQMRKALGLLGESSRHRQDPERMEQPAIRGPDRFNGGLHRRRFVQDGDIPVTVLRREPGHEAQPHRSVVTAAVPAPSTSRLQRTEAALAAETAARDRAERQLIEALAAARDLQTKIGHYELAKNEAIDALRHEREAQAALRTNVEALTAQLHEAEGRVAAAEQLADEAQAHLADERTARKNLEKSLRAAELARDAARQRAADLSDQLAETIRPEPPLRRRPMAEPVAVAPVAVVPAKRGRPPLAPKPRPELEQEPVKWWLAPAKPGAKRA